MSADTSDQLVRLGVGQKVKPRAKTDDSSLGSGVWDRGCVKSDGCASVMWFAFTAIACTCGGLCIIVKRGVKVIAYGDVRISGV